MVEVIYEEREDAPGEQRPAERVLVAGLIEHAIEIARRSGMPATEVELRRALLALRLEAGACDTGRQRTGAMRAH